jgi:hypothetical protein
MDLSDAGNDSAAQNRMKERVCAAYEDTVGDSSVRVTQA